MGRPRNRRRRNARKAAHQVFDLMSGVESIIQCGLGDWAEGPVILERFPGVPIMAVEPITRYIREAHEAGFPGEILQAVLWDQTGRDFTFPDQRTCTSIHADAIEGKRMVVATSYTLDDAVEAMQFKPCEALLWMDCEGAESQILDGARTTLRKVKYLLCEMKEDVSADKYQGWSDAEVLQAKIEGLGFRFLERIRGDGIFERVVL